MSLVAAVAVNAAEFVRLLRNHGSSGPAL
jgi:hypothetical protein